MSCDVIVKVSDRDLYIHIYSLYPEPAQAHVAHQMSSPRGWPSPLAFKKIRERRDEHDRQDTESRDTARAHMLTASVSEKYAPHSKTK